MLAFEEWAVRLSQLCDNIDRLVLSETERLHTLGQQRPQTRETWADIAISLAWLGRTTQLLKSVRLLALHGLGTSAAVVARSMWETWIDAAWLYRDRDERSTDLWTSNDVQNLAFISSFERWDGYLTESYEVARQEILQSITQTPKLYQKWMKEGQPKSFHAIKWANHTYAERCKVMGNLYQRSYDIEYALLSSIAHGDAMGLSEQMQDLGNGQTVITPGAGRVKAMERLLLANSFALMLAYEIQHGYVGGHTAEVENLKTQVAHLRREYDDLVPYQAF